MLQIESTQRIVPVLLVAKLTLPVSTTIHVVIAVDKKIELCLDSGENVRPEAKRRVSKRKEQLVGQVSVISSSTTSTCSISYHQRISRP